VSIRACAALGNSIALPFDDAATFLDVPPWQRNTLV
jgi:hypothetical protein